MRILKILCLVFLILISFLFFILWFFFITDRGVYLMLSSLTSHVSSFKIGSVTGNLLHGVRIKDLYYHRHGSLVRSSELYITLDFRNLWRRSFCVRSLFFKDLYICVDVAKFNKSLLLISDTKKIISRIIGVYPIIFSKIILNNVSIQLDDIVIFLNHCNTALIYSKEVLTVPSTFFSGLKILNFFDVLKMKVPIIQLTSLKNVFFNKSSLSTILKYFSHKSFCKKKNIKEIIFYNFIFEKIEGENIIFSDQENFLIKKLYVQGIISREYIRLVVLDIVSSYGSMHISGNIQFNKRYPISLIMNFCEPSSLFRKRTRIDCFISGSLNQSLCVYSNFLGAINGHLILKLDLDRFDVPVSLILDIDDLDRLFFGNFDYFIRKLHFSLDGTYNDYKLSLASIISSNSLLCSVDVIMNATGNINNLVISDLKIRNSNAFLDISGVIDNYNDFTDWNIRLILKKINILRSSFVWPLRLSGEINAQVNFFDHARYHVNLFNIFLIGTIRNCHSVNFRSLLFKNSFNVWTISQFSLSIGENTLRVNEFFKDDSIVTVAINFPFLNNIFPDLSGEVFGYVNILFESHGYYALLMDLTAKSLCLMDGGLRIEHAFLKSNLRYHNVFQGHFRCELNHLVYGSLFLSKSIFHVGGNIKNHDLKLSMYANFFNVILHAHGCFDYVNKSWYGNIIKINLIKQIMSCQWDRKLMIFYRKLPKQLIFLSSNLDKCVFRIHWYGLLEKWGIEKFIQYFHNIHLVIQQSFFLRSSHVNGKITSDINLTWDKGACLPCGKISLLGSGIEWVYLLLGEKSFIVFNDLVLNVVLRKDHIFCDWLSKFSDFSRCTGELKILLFDQYQCSGNLFVKNISLSFLNIFLDINDITGGILNLDLRISGNLFCPEIYGDIVLRNFIISENRMPFVIKSSKLLLNFTKNRFVLCGFIDTPHGKLHLNGNTCWHNNIQSIYSHVRITGHNVRLKLSPTVSIDISPVIICELTPSLFVLKGTLNIPSGYIGLKEYFQSADISSDEVIISKNICKKFFSARESRDTFTTMVDIMLRFGDDVEINAFGINAKLGGNLEVIYDKYGLGLKGYVNLLKGTFNIYGQNLFIKKGQLLFSGLIDSEPCLNIEAVRNPEWIQSTSAGIRITGSISSPEVEIFSDDAISQEEAVFYLLSGQRLNILNMSSNNTIRSVLIRLGLFHTERFVKQFGGILGIKDLVISTHGFGSNSQVVVSGNLAPGLQVKYGIGIFDSSATITLRYFLLPNFYLESIFGSNQIFDLVYQFKY